MAEIDLFANQLLEEAKRFNEKAKEQSDETAKAAYLHASLMLAFCAFDAHINAIGEEFSIRKDLSAQERGFLLEREVRLVQGEFKVSSGLKMARLEDRIELLHAKFSGKPLDRSATWWSSLSLAMDIRNQLTHAKVVPTITEGDVRNALSAIIGALEALYRAIYKRPFPPFGQELRSSLIF